MKEKAEKQLRLAHQELTRLIRRSESTWSDPTEAGLTPEALLRHMAELGESVVERLRVANAATPPSRPPERTGRQAAALTWLVATWNVAPGLLHFEDGPRWEGNPESPEDLLKRHTQWIGSYVSFLRELPDPVLKRCATPHPTLGPLNAHQWARLLRAYIRGKGLEYGL